jgi:hypothetical protein
VKKKRQAQPISSQQWHECDEPTRMLRWSRHVANARRYLLLCCALVRNWPGGGVQTELGVQVLQAIEQEARARPQRNARLNEDVLAERFPEVFRPGEMARLRTLTERGRQALRTDANWAWVFAQEDRWVRQTTKALPNVLIPELFLAANQAAARESQAELMAIHQEVRSRPRQRIAGKFAPWNPSTEDQIRDAILARLTKPPATVPNATPSQWQAQAALCQQRWQQRNAQTTALVCGLIREMFGDPTSPWCVKPEWLEAHGGVVRGIAEHVDQTGDFSELPILGDALEDAGCSDEAALQHCRGGGPHALGCWVVDALLKPVKASPGIDPQVSA